MMGLSPVVVLAVEERTVEVGVLDGPKIEINGKCKSGSWHSYLAAPSIIALKDPCSNPAMRNLNKHSLGLEWMRVWYNIKICICCF